MSPWISVHHCQDFYSYLDKDNHLNKESFPSFGVEVEIQPSSGFGSHEGGDHGCWMWSGSICSISIYKYPSRFCVSGIGTPYSGETQPSSPSQSLWFDGVILFAACLDMWSKPVQSEHLLLLATTIGSRMGMWPKLGQWEAKESMLDFSRDWLKKRKTLPLRGWDGSLAL